MVNKFRIWLVALALGLGIAGQASATVYSVGDLTTYNPAYTSTATFASGASISDTYSFSLPSAGSFSAILASLGFGSIGISNLQLSLSGPGVTATYTPNPAGFIYTGNLLLAGGAYLAGVTGLAGTGGGLYSLQMAAQVAQVPEPSGWMMLLAGLALVGFMAKRRSDLI